MTDKFLGVGGTDGTNARPLKMDVEGNLEVRDIDVKAELELIKYQQAEILTRLGEPIDTQLTGSKVERLFESTKIEVSAGATLQITDKIDVRNYKYHSLLTRDDTNIETRCTGYSKEGTFISYRSILLEGAANGKQSGYKPLLGEEHVYYVRNTTAEDRLNMKIIIQGVR